MSASTSTRCLFCRTRPLGRIIRHRPRIQLQSYHTTPSLLANSPKPSPPSKSKPSSTNAISPTDEFSEIATTTLHQYTPEEWRLLSKKYTPAQLSAIKAGEESIDPDDLIRQGTFRSNPDSLSYIDDFSKIRPIIDNPIRNPESNYDPKLRYKSEEELLKDAAQMEEPIFRPSNSPIEGEGEGEVEIDPNQEISHEEARLMQRKWEDQHQFTIGKYSAEKFPTSALSPILPKMSDPSIRYPSKDDEFEKDPLMQRVYQQTGFDADEVRRFRIKTLVTHRVVNQTRMGKISSIYMLTVAGNEDGLLGIGEGKASEYESTRNQARRAAIRNMQPIKRYERRTIFGDVEAKVGAAVVKIMSRPPGTYIPL
ncbi:MAG: Arp2/3 complex subunit, actin nucleation center [Watsoniomyces obsoletus]|nr:MAG: Arp2/3 complex subunit, actin nucleation center [Watsoniomyces obsoletus]